MKFTTLIALVASASAASNVKTLQLKDQMKSLQSMVKTAQTHDAQSMISAIQDRKADLEYQLALNGDKQMIAKELTYLLDLVQNIEANDFEGATNTLNHRKNKLFKYQMHLQEADAPEADTTDATTTDATTTDATTTDGTTTDATTTDGTTTDGQTADGTTTDGEAVPKSKTGPIIGGVAGGLVLVGGIVYCMKKGKDDNEGGEMEDKKLFKAQFKGNTVKKVQKEALVPTFAIPAEENI
jgi:hypothetical protein